MIEGGPGDYVDCLLPGANVSGLDVLISVTLDLVLAVFLVEADPCCGHDLTRPVALGVDLHLKITERVVGGASIPVELDKRHVARGDDGNDGVCASLPLAGYGNLVAGGADDVNAALIFLVERAAKSVSAFVLGSSCKTVWAFGGTETRRVASLEIGADVA
jgi:hypothetical protein